jgi:hypothetical protein
MNHVIAAHRTVVKILSPIPKPFVTFTKHYLKGTLIFYLTAMEMQQLIIWLLLLNGLGTTPMLPVLPELP